MRIKLLLTLLLSAAFLIGPASVPAEVFAQETLVDCPDEDGPGIVKFVNSVKEAKGRHGRNLQVRWDRIEEDMDPPATWFHRLRAIQLSFIWINKADPANDYGKIDLDPMVIGTQEKGQYKLMSLEEPGFQKHRISRALSKKLYFTGYTYHLLCAPE